MGLIPQFGSDASEETLLPYITAVTTQTRPFNPESSVPMTSNDETRNLELDSNGIPKVGKAMSRDLLPVPSTPSSGAPELEVNFEIRQLLQEEMVMTNISTSVVSGVSMEIADSVAKLQIENERVGISSSSKSETAVDLEDESNLEEDCSEKRSFSQFARSPLLKQDLISTLQILKPERMISEYGNKDKWSASKNAVGPQWKNCKGSNLNNLLTEYIKTFGSTITFQMSHLARGSQGIACGPQEGCAKGTQGLANGPNPAFVCGPVGFERDYLAPIPESDDKPAPDMQKSVEMLLDIKSCENIQEVSPKSSVEIKVESTDTAESEETKEHTPTTSDKTVEKLIEEMKIEDNAQRLAQPIGNTNTDEVKKEIVVSSEIERPKSIEMVKPKSGSAEKVDGVTMEEYIARYMEELRLKTTEKQEQQAKRKSKPVEQISIEMTPTMEEPRPKSVEKKPTPAPAAEPVVVQHAVHKPILEPPPPPHEFEYKFRTNWDGTLPQTQAEITVKFTIVSETGLQIDVEAPFFDDPKVPPEFPPGPVEGLWNYEIVEVFLMGINNKYLEIMLGPRGHYLVYYLEGVLQLTDKTRTLSSYTAGIRSDRVRWKATAVVPWKHMPPGLNLFNSYAMHKTYPARVYMALYPTQYGQFQFPDFHRLQFFRQLPIEIVQAAEEKNPGQTSKL